MFFSREDDSRYFDQNTAGFNGKQPCIKQKSKNGETCSYFFYEEMRSLELGEPASA